MTFATLLRYSDPKNNSIWGKKYLTTDDGVIEATNASNQATVEQGTDNRSPADTDKRTEKAERQDNAQYTAAAVVDRFCLAD